jgi:hypothetical protein
LLVDENHVDFTSGFAAKKPAPFHSPEHLRELQFIRVSHVNFSLFRPIKESGYLRKRQAPESMAMPGEITCQQF